MFARLDFGTNTPPQTTQRFSSVPENLFPASRFAARPTSGTTCSRPRKKWSPHRQGAYSSRPHNSSTPGGSGRLPVSSLPVSCGKGNRRLALYGRQYVFSLMCSLHFSLAVLPEKASCPIPAACSSVGTLPGLRDILSRSGSLQCFPCQGIPFRTVIHFQGAAHR